MKCLDKAPHIALSQESTLTVRGVLSHYYILVLVDGLFFKFPNIFHEVLSCVEEWIARSTVEWEDTGSNPTRSFDGNHAKKLLFLRIFYAL